MLSLASVFHSFGAQQVLRDVSITIDRSTHAALVGSNGSGKTTLLRILADSLTPEAGRRNGSRDLRVHYLPQHLEPPPGSTVRSIADQAFEEGHLLTRRRTDLETELKADPHNSGLLEELADVTSRLDHLDHDTRSARIGRVLNGLAFRTDQHDSAMAELSGGWRMRAFLARALLSEPDLLLLDEPTNYLDTEARLWLSGFLRNFGGAFVLVSHDRAFLDETVTEIYEVFQGAVRRYRGTYSDYERTRRAELDQLVKAWHEQQREIQRQEEFIRRFRATASKAKQVQSRIQQLQRTERISLPEHLRPVAISLPPPPPSSEQMVEFDGVTFAYDTQPVIEGLRLPVHRGRRLAVVGRNGAGKSTLMGILAGTLTPDEGRVRHGSGVVVAYLPQDAPERLPRDQSIFEFARSSAGDRAERHIRDVLGAFLFSGDTVDKPIGVLSGGEKSRVAIAAMLLRPANLLVLDEPTNHLDMASQNLLAAALRTYDGGIMIVSHDRDLLRATATDVLALWPREASGESVPAHRWRYYPGAFGEFETTGYATVLEAPAGSVVASRGRDTARTTEALTGWNETRAQRAELRKLRSTEESLMDAISEAEERERELQELIASPDTYRDGDRVKQLVAELDECREEHARLVSQWEHVSERLARLA